jgi:hypothetical protein
VHASNVWISVNKEKLDMIQSEYSMASLSMPHTRVESWLNPASSMNELASSNLNAVSIDMKAKKKMTNTNP